MSPIMRFTYLSSRPNNAFTLIELLVVIAIIALLAAILFPVFARARENARRSSCASNEKQLGLAVQQYTQDYDERYLPVGIDNPARNWGILIQPYVKSVQVLKCPSNSTTGTMNWNPASEIQSPISYGMNYHIGYVGGALGNALPLSAIDSPSQKILFAETRASEAGLANTDWTGTQWGNTYGFAGHLGTWNCAFADGHVKALRPLKTMVPYNMWGQFNDNTAADGPNCGTSWSINCDVAGTQSIAGMAGLDQKYN